jgi:hypothetical protein
MTINSNLLYKISAVICLAAGIFVAATKGQSNTSESFGTDAVASLSSITATDLCALCISSGRNDTALCHAYLAGFRDGDALQIMADHRLAKAARYICIPPNTPDDQIQGIIRKRCREDWKDHPALVLAGAVLRRAYSCH